MPCSSSRSRSAGRRRRCSGPSRPNLSGTAAAVSIALINGIANICGVALPPLMGYIKDTTNTYDYALLLVAAALVSGGAVGLYRGSAYRPHETDRVTIHVKCVTATGACLGRRTGESRTRACSSPAVA